MDLNNADVTPDARHIVGRFLLNGTEVPCVSVEVDSNAFYSADTFSAVFALQAMPSNMGLLDWWSKQTSIEMEVHVGIISKQTTDWEMLILGNVDGWEFNPAKFEVRVEGRDFTSKLIDTKTSEKFQNLTSSQVATLLAKRHGLTPVVTATKTQIGTMYQLDKAHVHDERTEWDLLSYLAGIEGYQVYVTGKELHFEPALDPIKQDQYLIKWIPPGTVRWPQANCTDDLSFRRDLTLAKGVTVTVASWHKGKNVSASYPANTAKGTAPGQSTPKRQVYSFVVNGLDKDGCQKRAQQLHKQITDHEMRMTCTLPGDNILMPSTIVRVEGTKSAFDQLYYVDSIRRSLSYDNGYTMALTAKNHNPNSMILP
ncbi:phage late control D family protein [Aquitalea sp. USM4]|uniref:phage late control D family protein n=1 Tax=Aquitalea sp. USM4 TaxID=1590041 RepID=UPI00103ED277|nr:rhs element Vgr protein [Aquitalea sp. USM4]QBJ80507.1 rhs element Vgr protein [Aquitalea sp. USM4]